MSRLDTTWAGEGEDRQSSDMGWLDIKYSLSTFDLCPRKYSGTSLNGPSEMQTTSVEWNNQKVLIAYTNSVVWAACNGSRWGSLGTRLAKHNLVWERVCSMPTSEIGTTSL